MKDIVSVLSSMLDELENCRRCELYRTRKKPVLGDGNPYSEVMLVGEAPGKMEDELGKPFVGKAGRLLDDMLAEIGLSRADIYITNVVKCRPPHNRDPKKVEIEACKVYLERQIELIRPKVVMTLGRFASAVILAPLKLSSIRGRIFMTKFANHSFKVIPTYHPAFILRNPHYIETYRADFIRLSQLIEDPSYI